MNLYSNPSNLYLSKNDKVKTNYFKSVDDVWNYAIEKNG